MSFLKKIAKYLVLKLSNLLFNLLYFKIQKKNITFCYHEISNKPSDFQKKFNLNVKPSVFRKQIQVLNNIFEKKNSFLISFDDGYEGSLTEGLKILDKFNIKPIYFICYYCLKNNFPLVSSLVSYLEKKKE